METSTSGYRSAGGPTRSRPTTLRTGTVLLAVCALAACGGGGGGGNSGGTGELDASFDWESGTHPFDTAERCTDTDDEGRPKGPGCTPWRIPTEEGAETDYVSDAVLLGAGSTLESEDGVTVTYRGAMIQRAPTDDPANPESLRILAAFDVKNDSPSVLWSGTPMEYAFAALGLKSVFYALYEPDMPECSLSRVPSVVLPEGEEGTFEFCWESYGPAPFLAGEPLINTDAYFDTEDTDAEFRASFKVLDQEYDDDVRKDINASAEQFSAPENSMDPQDAAAAAQERFAEWEAQGWGDLTGSADEAEPDAGGALVEPPPDPRNRAG